MYKDSEHGLIEVPKTLDDLHCITADRVKIMRAIVTYVARVVPESKKNNNHDTVRHEEKVSEVKFEVGVRYKIECSDV